MLFVESTDKIRKNIFSGNGAAAHGNLSLFQSQEFLYLQLGRLFHFQKKGGMFVQKFTGSSGNYFSTQAVKQPEFVTRACQRFPGHIIVGLDAKDGLVAIDGWATVTEHKVVDLATRFEQDGVEAIVYTDIGRDGMLTGPNVEATAALAARIGIPIVASGGITNIEDVLALCEAASAGITAAITGRAIYEGTLDFAEGQRLADEYR